MSKTKPNRMTASTIAQLRALRSRLRGRICDVVYSCGQATVHELAEQLGAQPTALYRHLAVLVDAGLIEEGPATRTTKNFAQTYRAKADRLVVTHDSDDPGVRCAIADVVESQLRHAGREFRAGIVAADAEVGTADSPLRSGSTIGWLGRAQRRKVNRLLDEILEVFENSRPGGDRELHAISLALRPVVHTAERS